MRLHMIILIVAGLALLTCSREDIAPSPADLPTPTLSAIDRAQTAIPGPMTDEAIARYRRTVRDIYALPLFDTESFCHSLRGLSNQEAIHMYVTLANNYGAGITAAGTDLEREVEGTILKEECERMY